jgi:hypothetical protein
LFSPHLWFVDFDTTINSILCNRIKKTEWNKFSLRLNCLNLKKTSLLTLKNENTYNLIKNQLYNKKAEFYGNSFFGKLKAKALIINK